MTTLTQLKVRGYHIDYFGHVNNARYLEFLEEGRWEFFEQHAEHFHGWGRKGFVFLVVNININYRRPASLGEVLEVHTKVTRLGDRSGTMHQEILLKEKGAAIIDADIIFVIEDSKTKKALPIVGELRDAFENSGYVETDSR
jgi:thioesterase III